MAGFIDLHPQAVASAGRATANTAHNWEAWASGSANLLRNTAAGAQEGVLTGAVEGYLSQWNPKMQGIAVQANNQGVNAVTGTGAMTGSDMDAQAGLSQAMGRAQSATGHVSRAITA